MQRRDLIDRLTGRPPHCTLLLIAFIGVSGCFPPPELTDGSRDTACGILYSCENDQGQRENDEVNGASLDGDSSGSGSGSGTGSDPGLGD